jgi:quinoprotein glucose dehydrogenase
LRTDDGDILLGDDIIADWRTRTEQGSVRLRAYYDVLPAEESAVQLSGNRRSDWGDPLPDLQFVDHDVSRESKAYSEATIAARLEEMVRAGDGTIVSSGTSDFQDHPAGGCRMGADSDTGVCDSYGRTFDHDNLFVVGAPTCVTGGCANGTLTFAALSLRAADAIGEAIN